MPIADVPLPGPAKRFDYQSFDSTTGRLYISHMRGDRLVVIRPRPAAHTPQAVPDFRHRPAEPTEWTNAHAEIVRVQESSRSTEESEESEEFVLDLLLRPA